MRLAKLLIPLAVSTLSLTTIWGQVSQRVLPGPSWDTARGGIEVRSFPRNKVMVVSHRGDWRHAPENSLWSVKCAADAGADVIEIDVSLTKDSILVLMHDKTIDRTTTGKGRVSELTYEQIRGHFLKDGLGLSTSLRVPTLEEVLVLCKDRVLLNVDKGFDYIDLIYPLVKKYGMLDQVIFKGTTTLEEYKRKYGTYMDHICFMPIINLQTLGRDKATKMVEEFLSCEDLVVGFEFVLGSDESQLIDFSPLVDRDLIVWMNSLRDVYCGGHSDDRAFVDRSIYDWFVRHHINCIQTDRIDLLISYLSQKGLYNHKE